MLFDLGLDNLNHLNENYTRSGIIYTAEKTTWHSLTNLIMVRGLVDIHSDIFSDRPAIKSLKTGPVIGTVAYIPGGTKGIYYGYMLEDMIDSFYQVRDFLNFNAHNGEIYSNNEVAEIYGMKNCDDLSYEERENRTHLVNGRPIPKSKVFLNSYGIADDIPQILKYYKAVITNPDVKVCLEVKILTPKSNPDFRWHKNGKYIGTQKPVCEHLGDEPNIKQIITFNFYQVGDKL